MTGDINGLNETDSEFFLLLFKLTKGLLLTAKQRSFIDAVENKVEIFFIFFYLFISFNVFR